MAYVTSFWNLLDLAGLALFLTGLVLRIVSFTTSVPAETRMEIVEWAHTLYVFALVIYYIRLTHACSISQELGPKVIMIAKMVRYVFRTITPVFASVRASTFCGKVS